MLIGTSVVEKVFLDYEEPTRPLYLSLVLSAGPIEETIFFGIPFYVFANNLVVLAGGIIWAMLHILNTNTFEMSALAYANWLFVIPSLFFSLRTWISGKGWFAGTYSFYMERNFFCSKLYLWANILYNQLVSGRFSRNYK